jgi:hypothetical protein
VTGTVALGILLAHLVGDYVLQSDWMATEKLKRWWPAVAHGLTYTLPYVAVTRSPWALAIIGGTHVVIDRYRLAKYLTWLKNQIGPRRNRPGWPPSATGYPAHVPAGLATALLIIADNTIHLVINFAAVLWL